MYQDWLKISNPSSHRFVTTFNKLRSATSPTRQPTHQDADSVNSFSTHSGTQHNGNHFFLRREDLSIFFLRREDLSRWISMATHLSQLAPNSLLTIYYSSSFLVPKLLGPF
jgi:hypothetical protein